MSTSTDQEKMQILINELNRASEAYYGGNSESMSDHEWDAKFDALTALERRTGIILPDSPTHKVSRERFSDPEQLVKHEKPALSLDKSKDIKDCIKWAENRTVDLSWKLDGLTLVITWDNGRLASVITRGDGYAGSDITRLAPAIANVPTTIPYKEHLVVRGEAVISYEDFDRIIQSMPTTDANGKPLKRYDSPRNLAAGSLNVHTKSVERIIDRGITWLPFTLVTAKDAPKNWSERMKFLQNLGLSTVDFETIEQPDLNLLEHVKKWSASVSSFKYPVDGLVLAYEDTEYAATGTLTGHHDTKGGFALKWEDEQKDTYLTDIEWSPSVNTINPVAIFEPVELENAEITRATLCNISEMKRLGIGGVGTQLTIIRANKVIPKVVHAEIPSGVKNTFDIPMSCPACGAATRVLVSEEGIETLVCTNDNCVAKNLSRMSRFVNKYSFNIKGLSDATLQKLIDNKLIADVSDILSLPEREEKLNCLIGTDGIGEKTVKKLVASIKKARTVDSDKMLHSLCIPMCGREMAKKLSLKYTIERLSEIITSDVKHGTNIFVEENIGDFGEIHVNEFIRYFKNPENFEIYFKVLRRCTVKNPVKILTGGKCAGITFVVTGSLKNYASRDDLKAYIEHEGGKLASSVSSKVNFLINNDNTSTTSKNQAAHELGIPIITEEEFINRFG